MQAAIKYNILQNLNGQRTTIFVPTRDAYKKIPNDENEFRSLWNWHVSNTPLPSSTLKKLECYLIRMVANVSFVCKNNKSMLTIGGVQIIRPIHEENNLYVFLISGLLPTIHLSVFPGCLTYPFVILHLTCSIEDADVVAFLRTEFLFETSVAGTVRGQRVNLCLPVPRITYSPFDVKKDVSISYDVFKDGDQILNAMPHANFEITSESLSKPLSKPTISHLCPSTGQANDEVILLGNELSTETRVFFGDERAKVTFCTNICALVCIVPSGDGKVDVKVCNGNHNSTFMSKFTYVQNKNAVDDTVTTVQMDI